MEEMTCPWAYTEGAVALMPDWPSGVGKKKKTSNYFQHELMIDTKYRNILK